MKLPYEHEVGEWISFSGSAIDPDTDKPYDLTGAVVKIRIRSGPSSSDSLIGAYDGFVVNASSGSFKIGFRINTVGLYYASIILDKQGIDGWPVIEQVQIKIVDTP